MASIISILIRNNTLSVIKTSSNHTDPYSVLNIFSQCYETCSYQWGTFQEAFDSSEGCGAGSRGSRIFIHL